MIELDKTLLCGPFILCVLSCVYDKWQSVFLLIPDESVIDKGPFNRTIVEGDNIHHFFLQRNWQSNSNHYMDESWQFKGVVSRKDVQYL